MTCAKIIYSSGPTNDCDDRALSGENDGEDLGVMMTFLIFKLVSRLVCRL